MALISRPSIPEIIFERIKSDLTEFAFNFFQDGIALDVSSRTYRLNLRGSGVLILEKSATTNSAGRVTFSLLNSEKSTLTASEYQLSLVEILTTGDQKTIAAGTLRWSVPYGKTTGLVSAPDVSINYIEASQELMIALGVVDLGSMSSSISAAAAAQSEQTALQAQLEVNELHSQVEAAARTIASQTDQVLTAKIATDSNLLATAALKQQVIDAIEDNAIYLGFWDASTDTPKLVGTAVPAAGSYYEIAKSGTQELTESPLTYEEGRRIRSNGIAWEQGGGLTPGDKSVTVNKFVDWIQRLFQRLPEDSPYLDVRLSETNQKLFAIRKADGFIEGKFEIHAESMMPNSVPPQAIQAGAVDLEKLAAAVKALIYKPFDNTDSEWLRMLLDDQNNLINGEKKTGETFISKPLFPHGSLKEDWIAQSLIDKMPTQSFMRINRSNPYAVAHQDDMLVRGNQIEVTTRTPRYVGWAYTQFPNKPVSFLKGINNTGADLLFRRIPKVPLRGKSFRGNFDPTISGVAGVNYRGTYGNSSSNSYPAFPAGSTGDCWVIDCGNTTATKTANGLSFKSGDCLVKTVSGYAIQPGPGDGTWKTDGFEFWNITNSGYFAGKYYDSNGRIYLPGMRSGGGPKWMLCLPSKPGELYLLGECDATLAPVNPRPGDTYVFSVAATVLGIAGQVGDLLTFSGAWHLVPGELVTVANGSAFWLYCTNSAEWLVRRSDKSATEAPNKIVDVVAFTNDTTIHSRSNDGVFLISDSMFGAGTIGSSIESSLTDAGREASYESYGGATAEEVLAMIKFNIASGDPHIGKLHIVWAGQNNGTTMSRVKAAIHDISALIGASDGRYVFWSILGQRNSTYDSVRGRIVVPYHEDAFNKTGFLYDLEQFYIKAFPKQWFSPRLALLKYATENMGNVPDLHAPGMSCAETAAQRGWVPLPFFLDYTTLPAQGAGYNFLGYRAAGALPTGGNNLDYYIEDSGIGALIIKSAGVWAKYDIADVTHLKSSGGVPLAGKFIEFITQTGL